MFGAVVCADQRDLARVTQEVRALSTVAETASILDVVPPDQPAKRAALARIGALLADLPTGEPHLPADPQQRLEALRAGVATLIDRLDDAARGSWRAAGRTRPPGSWA